jgi:hypothetical protein
LRKKSGDLFTPRVDGRNPSLDALKGKANDSNVLFNRLNTSTIVYHRKTIQDFICAALNNVEGGVSLLSKVILFMFLCTSRVT